MLRTIALSAAVNLTLYGGVAVANRESYHGGYGWMVVLALLVVASGAGVGIRRTLALPVDADDEALQPVRRSTGGALLLGTLACVLVLAMPLFNLGLNR